MRPAPAHRAVTQLTAQRPSSPRSYPEQSGGGHCKAGGGTAQPGSALRSLRQLTARRPSSPRGDLAHRAATHLTVRPTPAHCAATQLTAQPPAHRAETYLTAQRPSSPRSDPEQTGGGHCKAGGGTAQPGSAPRSLRQLTARRPSSPRSDPAHRAASASSPRGDPAYRAATQLTAQLSRAKRGGALQSWGGLRTAIVGR